MEKIAKECMLNTRLFPSDKFRGLPSEFEYGMSVLDKHTVILDDSEDEEGGEEEGGEKGEEGMMTEEKIAGAVANLGEDLRQVAESEEEGEVDKMLRLLAGQEEDDSDVIEFVPDSDRESDDDGPPALDENGNESPESSAPGFSAEV